MSENAFRDSWSELMINKREIGNKDHGLLINYNFKRVLNVTF